MDNRAHAIVAGASHSEWLSTPAISVSVVIPTRNRLASLHRALTALEHQQRRPDEVIVLDASDSPPDASTFATGYPGLKLAHFRAAPSVCASATRGFARRQKHPTSCCWTTTSKLRLDYLACDWWLPSNAGPKASVPVTGVWSEPNAKGQVHPMPSSRSEPSASLLINFIAQRTVWGDIEAATANTDHPPAFSRCSNAGIATAATRGRLGDGRC